MWDRPDAGADAHWAAVSQATLMSAHWRAQRRRERLHRLRQRLGLHLVHVGLRVANPVTAQDLLQERA